MRRLTFIVAVLMVCGGAKLPVPKFAVFLPVPRWTTEITEALADEQIHTAEPTIKPVVLTHSYRTWGRCGCLMCLGQHLRNMHGLSYETLEGKQWVSMHNRLHDKGVAPKAQSGCADGKCAVPRRKRYLFSNPFRR